MPPITRCNATSTPKVAYNNRRERHESMIKRLIRLKTFHYGGVLAAASLSAALAWGQSGSKLTAREIFYAPAPKPAATDQKQVKSTPQRTAPKSTPEAKETKSAPKSLPPTNAPEVSFASMTR